jgi:hypothetical protein
MRIRSQRGSGGIGCLLLIGIVVAVVYSGFMFAMPKFRNSGFEDRLNESIVYFGKQPPERIRQRVIDIARDFDITLGPENVKVLVQGDHLTLDVSYEKVVDLKVWKKTLAFSSHRSGSY